MTIFEGPIFFGIGVLFLAVGVVLGGMFWRQGWILASLGFLALALGVPGPVGWCAGGGGFGTFVVFLYWQSKKIGRTL